jgi:hypothetical protein
MCLFMCLSSIRLFVDSAGQDGGRSVVDSSRLQGQVSEQTARQSTNSSHICLHVHLHNSKFKSVGWTLKHRLRTAGQGNGGLQRVQSRSHTESRKRDNSRQRAKSRPCRGWPPRENDVTSGAGATMRHGRTRPYGSHAAPGSRPGCTPITPSRNFCVATASKRG